MNNEISFFDATFELDAFQEIKTSNSYETIKNIILKLIRNEEGFYPSIPWLGINLASYLYEFFDDIDVNKIRHKLISQCEALEEYFDKDMIVVKKVIYRDQPCLLILIGVITNNNIKYGYVIGLTLDDNRNPVYDVSEISNE